MTAAVANIVTSGTGATSGGANTSKPDDGFAEMLGGAMQRPANDMAVVPTLQDGAQTATDAKADPSQDPAALLLQSLQALQEVVSGSAQPNQMAAPQDTVSNPSDIAASQPNATQDPGASATSDPSADLPVATDTTRPNKTGECYSTSDVAPGKPVVHANDAAMSDPTLAQMLAAQQPLPATIVAATALDSSAQKSRLQTDPLQNGGATTKPGAPDGKPADDSEKTQGSTGAAFADPRNVSDQKASGSPALPLHAAADLPKNNSQSGGSPSQQHDSANTATPPTDLPAANPPLAPAHMQTAVQPDAPTNPPAAAPIASVAANAAAPAAVQLQVSHPALPDLNSLAFNIATKSEGGARHFDIRLDPAELGRVDVRLTVDDAGKAQATLSVEKPQTLELLQKDQGHLERALKDAGLDLSQNGLNFSLKGQQQQNSQGGDTPSPRGRALAVHAIAAAETAASNLSLSGVGASDTRLDIRV